jgi:hypothetical protein
VPLATEKEVVASVAEKDVVAFLAKELVVFRPTDEDVVP